MCILLDVMLVKLARWLRMLGISAELAPFEDDKKILDYIKNKDCILITKDVALARSAKRNGNEVLLIESDDIKEELRYVINMLNLKVNPNNMICPLCNNKLGRISKKELKGIISNNIIRRHREFFICKKCKKIYWKGSHWKIIKRVAKEIR